jgi:hypothetical protein
MFGTFPLNWVYRVLELGLPLGITLKGEPRVHVKSGETIVIGALSEYPAILGHIRNFAFNGFFIRA